MTKTLSSDARRRACRRRYALPISIAAALVCGAVYTLEASLPPIVQLPVIAVGLSGALAPIIADDWVARRSILSNLWVWIVVVALGTWFFSVRAPDAQGPLLSVPMLIAIGAGWPIATLYRQRARYRRTQAREERKRRQARS